MPLLSVRNVHQGGIEQLSVADRDDCANVRRVSMLPSQACLCRLRAVPAGKTAEIEGMSECKCITEESCNMENYFAEGSTTSAFYCRVSAAGDNPMLFIAFLTNVWRGLLNLRSRLYI